MKHSKKLFGCLGVTGLLYAWWILKESVVLETTTNQNTSLIDGTARSASSLLQLPTFPSNAAGTNVIYPGELPGYTGWARPATTLAGSFGMDGACSTTTPVHTEWTCTIRCKHAACLKGGSLFYARAYGPAILPGRIDDHGNGGYNVTFLPMDEGVYTVEVVLTFSNPSAFGDFPLKKNTEPAYEGYMLPGFPLYISLGVAAANDGNPGWTSNAVAPVDQSAPLPPCTTADILVTDSSHAVQKGRWKVQEKITNQPFDARSQLNNATLEGYRRGDNSLGIRMDYEPATCTLMDVSKLKDSLIVQTCRGSMVDQTPRKLHVLAIGDSNIQRQFDYFADQGFLSGWPSGTYISTKDGLLSKLGDVEMYLRQELQQGDDAPKSSGKDFVILFNSGLHDIVFLCGNGYFGLQANLTARGTARCVDTYRNKLRELATLIKQFPSVLTVFQTTMAAWPKWGVFGAAWPANATQPMPFVSDFAHHFNDIAVQVMTEFNIPIMDAYWMTYSRPDHREVTADNLLSGKMAHAGQEVTSVLTRQWFTMILEAICPRRVDFEATLLAYQAWQRNKTDGNSPSGV